MFYIHRPQDKPAYYFFTYLIVYVFEESDPHITMGNLVDLQ